jgi:hypothetical protein
MEFYSNKKNEILFAGKSVQLKNITLSEVSEVKKANIRKPKHSTYIFAQVWNIGPIKIQAI